MNTVSGDDSRLELLIRYSSSAHGHASSPGSNLLDPLVVFEFPNNPRLGKRRVKSSELGIFGNFAAHLAALASFRIPEEIAWFLRQGVENRPLIEPLWLVVQRDRGWLTAFPWEQLLAESMQTLCSKNGVCDRPILRKLSSEIVVDATLEPIDVVICATSPQASMSFDVADKVRHLIDTISRVQTSALTVHVFGDGACFERIESPIMNLPQTKQRKTIVYSPMSAKDYTPEPRKENSAQTTEVLNPWLRWMLDSLSGRSVDAVHFVCPAWMQSDNPCLAFAESPTHNRDPYWARFVGVGQLTKFLICSGAWSACFSSVHHDYSTIAFRLLAGELAGSWPKYISLLRENPNETSTAWDGIYRFLLRKQREIPALKELSLYASPQGIQQPEALESTGSSPVTGHLILGKSRAFRSNLEIAEAFSGEQLPSWFVAGNRYLENFVASPQYSTSDPLSQAVSESAQKVAELRTASNEVKQESADYATEFLLNLQRSSKDAK